MAKKAFWVHAITPVHVGTGSSIGYVDLPIAREKTTDWPLIPGSGLKGVWSDARGASEPQARRNNPVLRAAFGIADETGDTQANSGAIVFTDARLVCLPVRSLYGTFAWLTCPMALRRLQRDLQDVGVECPKEIPTLAEENRILVPAQPTTSLAFRRAQQAAAKAYFADLDFDAHTDAMAQAWANKIGDQAFPVEWRQIFKQRFAVASDDTFGYFCQFGTEIVTRIRLEPGTKTVGNGLWTEELLPAEALLSGLATCGKLYHQSTQDNGTLHTDATLLNAICRGEEILQVGGKATVGRGRVRITFSSPAAGAAQ